MDEPPGTRHSLIVRLRDPADPVAWGEFVALYEPLVYQLGRKKGLQDADAQDLCQEVFQAVARSVDRWDPARGSFRAWLSRIARNLLINLLSRRPYRLRGSGATSVQELLEAQPAADPPATALFEAEYRRRLFAWAAGEIRREFTATSWQAFWQTAVEDRPPREVAAELGISIGAVYVARSRILSRFRQQIEKVGDDTASLVHAGVDHALAAEYL